MHTRFIVIAAALAASPAVWAAASTVEVYGTLSVYPGSGTYAAAADIGANLFSDPPFVPQISTTDVSNALAAIASTDYSASARTTLGSNHAYSQASGFSSGALGINSLSGWYDQVTVTNGTGTGTGTLQFSVQLTGSVTAGAHLGAAGFSLLASSVHPEQLATDLQAFNMLNPQPWGLYDGQVQAITTYSIVASPYNDPDVIAGLFSTPSGGDSGIPALQLGEEDGMGFPEFTPDLIVTPGAEHLVNITLTGTLDFTYGEAFYLIGALGTSVLNLDAFLPFCSFEMECPGNPPANGTGATTLDFLNSALLTGIVLPEGASFASASGAAYNVTAVPEPGEWAMLLAGLGLVAWRTRRKTA
ncbi:MAG: PEP-CTERM sorting domain-containing protein [Thiobacillus sp.]|nr:PEP-CTERM sorting domain-containing protein [Thiobacillus sp.]